MIATTSTSAAARFAQRACAGRFDRTGRPLFDHYRRLAEAMETEQEACAALLAGALEGPDATSDELSAAGLPDEAVRAAGVLARGKAEDYFDYIARVKEDALAARVKRCELDLLIAEMDDYVSLTGTDRKRRSSYEKARDLLDGTDELLFDGTFASQHGQAPVPAAPPAPAPPGSRR
ncbi:MAG TPA: hypothetical protein IAC12_06045 [Candidatus Aphodovivens avistercoris]|nr:hypothetical protein [Candidatus Aphodovivens avistercoris]